MCIRDRYLADLIVDVFFARQSAFEGFAGLTLQVVACIGDMVCSRYAVTEPPDSLHLSLIHISLLNWSSLTVNDFIGSPCGDKTVTI